MFCCKEMLFCFVTLCGPLKTAFGSLLKIRVLDVSVLSAKLFRVVMQAGGVGGHLQNLRSHSERTY